MTSNTGADDPHARPDELRVATLSRAASLVSSFDGIVEAASDVASDVATDDEHDPEGHTIAWERQQIAALLDETKAALDAIDIADQRLDEGMYRICVSCGLEIELERLHALPATATCIGCAD